jgi:molybdopterin converting factor small subunit
MQITVKLFARARDLVGADQVELELPGQGAVRDIKQSLAVRFPQLAPLLPGLLVAIGNNYARDDAQLTSDAEIACFPPVSGG